MKPRVALLLALLVLPLAAPEAHAARAPWWDPAWHFRLPLDLAADAVDPVDGRAIRLSGASDVALLVPVDFTAAVRNARAWPLDASGAPVGWTFDPASIRVVPVDETGAAQGAPLPSRFLPFSPDGTAPAFDARTHAAGELAILVPGAWSGARRVDVYFDIAEHAPVPAAPADPRFSALFGPGVGIRAMLRVPAIPSGATARLALLAPAGAPHVRIERVDPGAAPALVAEADAPARVALPSADEAYDLLLLSDAPVLAALETVGTDSSSAALAAPALAGGFAGRAFLLPSLGGATTWDLVGARRAAWSAVACDDGHALASGTLEQLATAALAVPDDGCARVTSDGPVLALARGSSAGGVDAFLHAAVSLDGSPNGELLVGERANGHALVADAPASAQAFPLANPSALLAGRAGDAPRLAWVSRAAPSDASAPWAFRATGATASALLGSDGLAVLAGDAGLDVEAPIFTDRVSDAPATLQGALELPFPGTRVETTTLAANGTTLAHAQGTISLAGGLATTPDGKAALLAEDTVLRVEATKPVFLQVWRPGAAFDAFLPTLPPQGVATARPLESYGALLAWSAPAKEASAKPGERARLELDLGDLGVAQDGSPLGDDPSLAVEPLAGGTCHAAWTPRLAQPNLPGGGRAQVLVDVPTDAQDGDCLAMRLVATSARDNATQAEARLTLRVRAGFEPVLRVLDAGGNEATRTTLALRPGEPASATLVLRNAGAEAGNATLAFASGPGYDAALLDANGTPVSRVSLAPNASATLALRLRAPTGAEPAWDFVVEATSAADPSARDQAVVAAQPQSNATVESGLDVRVLHPVPGRSDNATLTIRNLAGDAQVRVRPSGALPAGWRLAADPPTLLLRAAGTRNETGAALDAATVRIEVDAPETARVGDTLPVTLLVEPALGGAPGARVGLVAVAANDLAVALETPDAIAVAPASSGSAAVIVRSDALAPLNLSLRSLAAPTGWNVTLDGVPDSLAPRQEARATLRWRVEPGAPAGAGNVTIDLAAWDEATPPAEHGAVIPARTLATPVLALVLPPEASVAPGAAVRVRALVRNDGNLPGPADVAIQGASLVSGAATGALAPGESRALELLANASADVRLAAGDATATLHVAALRRDLAIVSATAEGGLLNVTVENRGDAAGLATLVVREGTRVLANRTLAAPAPGARVAQLLLVGSLPGNATVEVEGADGAADLAPADNVATIAGATPARETPGAAPLVAILLAIVFRRRAR